MADDEARMSFTEHLGELRTRIIRSGIALVVGIILCYALSNYVFEIVRRPLAPLATASVTTEQTEEGDAAARNGQWTVMNPLEPVLVKLKLAAYAGVLISLPVILYQLCAFIFPGLRPREKKAARILIFGCSCLAIAGTAVAYFFVFPLVLPYLMHWMPDDFIVQLRMSENVNLIIKGLMAFAIAFQFPMVVLALVYLELLTPATLKKYRRIAIVAMALAAAMLTPPDPGSMIMMMLPLVLLYEISIWVSYLVVRRKRKASEAEA